MPIFTTPQPITAHIDVAAGSVRLVATERTDTVVEVRPFDESRPGDVKAAEQARVELVNDTLRVAVHRRGLAWGRIGAVAVVIELPARSTLRAQLASAGLSTEGQLGHCRVDSASGDLDLDQTAALTVNTASGDVSVGRVTSGAKFSTASGAVSVRSLDGAASIRTASGPAVIGDLTGELTFESASAQVSVDTLRGFFRAATASGDITVGAAVQGSLALNTASGEVEIGIPEGTAAHLDLHTGSGSVRNRLEPSDGPRDGEGSVSVRARTASGDIAVRRSMRTGAA